MCAARGHHICEPTMVHEARGGAARRFQPCESGFFRPPVGL